MTAVQWETEERRKEVRVMSNSGENRSGGRAIKKKKKNIYEAMHWASGCEPKELKPCGGRTGCGNYRCLDGVKVWKQQNPSYRFGLKYSNEKQIVELQTNQNQKNSSSLKWRRGDGSQDNSRFHFPEIIYQSKRKCFRCGLRISPGIHEVITRAAK